MQSLLETLEEYRNEYNMVELPKDVVDAVEVLCRAMKDTTFMCSIKNRELSRIAAERIHDEIKRYI
jgi:hypothetical protein